MSAKIRPAHRGRPRGAAVPPRPPHLDAATETVMLAVARRGDLRGWDWLIRRHQELIYRSAYLSTRDSGMAEAVTIDTFTRAHRSLPSLESGAPLRPWLMGIADNVARIQLRASAQRRDDRLPEAHPCPRLASTPIHQPPGIAPSAQLEQARLVEAFDELIDRDRNTIAARYAFALGRDEAASRLGIESEGLDERLKDAMARLRSRAAEATAKAEAPDAEGRSRAYWPALDRYAAPSDDQLGLTTMVAVLSQLRWYPDVAPTVGARLAREAVAYPESLPMASSADRLAPLVEPAQAGPPAVRSSRRSGWNGRGIGLLAGVSLVVIAITAVGLAADSGSDLGAGLRSAVRGFLERPQGGPPTAGSAARPAEAVPVLEAAVPIGAPGVAATPDPAAAVAEGTPPVGADPDAEVAPWRPGFSIVGADWREDRVLTAVVRVVAPPNADAAADGRARLEGRSGTGAWAASTWTGAADPLLTRIAPDTAYEFRIRTIDTAGAERVSQVARVELAVRGPRSARLDLSRADWDERRSPSGWRRLLATRTGATARTEFSGTDVAIVGPAGRSRGALGVRIDGGPWLRDPAAFGPSERPVLFSGDLGEGRHALDIRAEADGLALDAILILRERGS